MADAESAALHALVASMPVPQPRLVLAWTAAVEVAAREALGPSPLGERFIVPITGGRFWGGTGHEALTGRVRPGGADRQLLRSDGIKELAAEYEIETGDGAVIGVLNRVLIDESVQPERYALSHLSFTAPEGPHAWLNRRRFVGTLQSLRPQRQAVLVRAWLVS